MVTDPEANSEPGTNRLIPTQKHPTTVQVLGILQPVN